MAESIPLSQRIRAYKDKTQKLQIYWPCLVCEKGPQDLAKLPHAKFREGKRYSQITQDLVAMLKECQGAGEYQKPLVYFIGPKLPFECRVRHFSPDDVEDYAKHLFELKDEHFNYPGFLEALEETEELRKLSEETEVVATTDSSASAQEDVGQSVPTSLKEQEDQKPAAKNKVPPAAEAATSQPTKKARRYSKEPSTPAAQVTPMPVISKKKKGPKSTSPSKVVHEFGSFPTFDDVKDSLKRLGFSLDNGAFQDIKREHTFESVEKFRKHLCAYGLNCSSGSLSEESKENLSLWVRGAIVDATENGKVPETYLLPDRPFNAITLLVKMGMVHEKNSLGANYILPGVEKENRMVGVNTFPHDGKRMEDRLFQRLARFGIGSEFDRSQLEPQELLGLQMFLTESDRDPVEWSFLDLSRLDAAPVEDRRSRTPRSTPVSLKAGRQSSGKSSRTEEKKPKKAQKTKPKDLSRVGQDLPPSIVKLLRRCGFKINSGKYYRVGVDSKKSGNILGRDFFDTAESFRSHLCAYGLDCSDSKLSDEEKEELTRWVRFAIVDVGSGEDIAEMSSKLQSPWAVIKKLKAIGLRTAKDAVGETVYVLPNGLSFKDEGVYAELFRRLARFGLQGFDTTALPKDEILDIQLYLTEPTPTGIDSFTRWKDDETKLVAAVKDSKQGRRATRVGRRMHSPIDPPSPSQTIVAAGSETEQGRDKKNKRKKSPRGSPSKKKRKKQDAVYDAVEVLEDEDSGSNKVNRWTDLFDMKVAADQPEGEAPDLDECLKRLSSCTSGERLAVLQDTSFGRNLREIFNFIMETASGTGEASSLYISGTPGVGKTSGVRWCLEAASSDETFETRSCIVSASSLASKNDAKEAIISSIAESIDSGARTENGLRQQLKKGPHFFLVIDEMDHMVSVNESDGERRVGAENVLSTLVDWSQDPDLRFSLIGISNAIGNQSYQRLRQVFPFDSEITFSTYTESEIVAILKSRVGGNFVAEPVFNFIAKKVQSTSGDARKAFDYMASAINSCREDKKAETVNMGHASKVFSMDKKALSEVVNGLPALSKVILCIVITLAREQVEVPLGRLKQLVKDCAMSAGSEEEMGDMGDFQNLLGTLVDTGLLIARKMDAKPKNPTTDSTISLSGQLEDVEKALETELFSRPYYQQLRDKTAAKAKGGI